MTDYRYECLVCGRHFFSQIPDSPAFNDHVQSHFDGTIDDLFSEFSPAFYSFIYSPNHRYSPVPGLVCGNHV